MKKVLQVLKKNLISVILGAVMLVAVVAYLIYPLPGMFSKFRAEVAARQATFNSLNGLLTATRTLPVLNPEEADANRTLDVFPTPRVIQQGNDAIATLKSEADAALRAATALNRRPLLLPGSLPKPNRLIQTRFLNVYAELFPQQGQNQDNALYRKVLKATQPPTDLDVNAIAQLRADQIAAKAIRDPNTQQIVNQAEIEREIAEMRSTIGIEVRRSRAEQGNIYVEPTAVAPHRIVQTPAGQPPSAVDIYNAQLHLWVQQTLLEAVAQVNANSKDVIEAPIKHLIAMTLPPDFAVPSQNSSPGFGGGEFGGMFGGGGEAAEAAPAEASSLNVDPTAPITPNYVNGPYGSSDNSFYEPIRVSLVLRVDATRVPEIVGSLSRGRLLQVRSVSMTDVPKAQALAAGYVYGNGPVAEVMIQANLLILKTWLVEFMPDEVKSYYATKNSGGQSF